MSENKPEEVFAVGDAIKFRRQDLSYDQVDGLIRLITSNDLTEPLVVTAVRNYEDARGRGHKQQITAETIVENKKTIKTSAFWFEKAHYEWIKEMHGQG